MGTWWFRLHPNPHPHPHATHTFPSSRNFAILPLTSLRRRSMDPGCARCVGGGGHHYGQGLREVAQVLHARCGVGSRLLPAQHTRWCCPSLRCQLMRNNARDGGPRVRVGWSSSHLAVGHGLQVLLGHVEAQALEHLLVHGVPVVHLLRGAVGGAGEGRGGEAGRGARV